MSDLLTPRLQLSVHKYPADKRRLNRKLRTQKAKLATG
jgi:hypothetical protein